MESKTMSAIESSIMRVMLVPNYTSPDEVQRHLIANGFNFTEQIRCSCALGVDDIPDMNYGYFFMQELGKGSA
jgi:hypothetical protein